MQIDNLKADRLKKLDRVIEEGWNPFASIVERDTTTQDALTKLGSNVKVVGRIYSLRTHGNITFADLKDESGKIQIFFKKEVLGDKEYKNLRLLDSGDFVSVEGVVEKTIAGEISVVPSTYKLLTKSLLPIPNEWFGLKDIETRYRKRYLDLLLNHETKEIFMTRSKIVSLLRQFLEKNGFIEVETPVLQPLYGGAAARPFTTYYNSLESDFYLRIAVELYLKRLIVGGFEKVYEIGKNFRNEGFSRAHNPEFTMLEFYWAYVDYEKLMTFTEEMFTYVINEIKGGLNVEFQGKSYDFATPWERVSYKDLFTKYLKINIDDYQTEESLWKYIQDNKLLEEKVVGYPQLLDKLYKTHVRPNIVGPVFVIDYPAVLLPLAKKSEKDPDKSASFQLVINGVEMMKAYNELNDPIDQRKRWEDDMEVADRGGDEYQVVDEDYLEALDYGMPPTAGWGLGVDRLVAFLTDQHSIKDVILFPTLRPEHAVVPVQNQQQVKVEKQELKISRTQAVELLETHLKNKNLINHCKSVEVAMGALAKHFDDDHETWSMAGLLHDADWEETQVDPTLHTIKTLEWIKEMGEENKVLTECILTHNHHNNGFREPKSRMEWSLYTCDELTGFIVAVALVKPDKKLSTVTVESVLKKFPQKCFAAPVDREQIAMCEEKLGIPLRDFVQIVLKSMQKIAPEIGL